MLLPLEEGQGEERSALQSMLKQGMKPERGHEDARIRTSRRMSGDHD